MIKIFIRIVLSLLFTLSTFSVPSYANISNSADCLTFNSLRFDPLGYNIDLSPYLTEAQKRNLDPAFALSISWGKKTCSTDIGKFRIAQFKFLLEIPGYNGNIPVPTIEIPIEIVDSDSTDFYRTYEVVFRTPRIIPGKYVPSLKVINTTSQPNSTTSIPLNFYTDVPNNVSTTPTPTPTPTNRQTPTNQPSSRYLSLYNTETVWIVGQTAWVYSCWNRKISELQLQVKLKRKWVKKTTARFSKDESLCSNSKFPWVAKYIWSVDEFGDTPQKNSRANYLLVRQAAGKSIRSASIARIVYASNADRYADAMDVIGEVLDLGLR